MLFGRISYYRQSSPFVLGEDGRAEQVRVELPAQVEGVRAGGGQEAGQLKERTQVLSRHSSNHSSARCNAGPSKFDVDPHPSQT